MIKLWWLANPKPGNFGDILTPHIFNHFGISYEYASDSFNTISTGSIAKYAKPETQVFGSGIMNINDSLCATAAWHWVRGPITRNRVIACGGTCDKIYGDPALLLPLFVPESDKEYDLGIVPHIVDYEYVKEQYPEHKVINLLSDDPVAVAREITQCRSVVSSSLHGIICAHAYGIPAAWIKFSAGLKGDDVKFYDHYAAVNADPTLSTWEDFSFTAPKIDLDPIADVFNDLSQR